MKRSNKGFTLIELMVVMAIIGVLAVMLVPQLSGAQERARDSGRIAAIQNITAVLETYFSDEGQYPIAPHSDSATTGNNCFSSDTGAVSSEIGALLKGGTAPLDPQATNIVWGCTSQSAFWYKALEKSWIAQAWYVITANVEGWKKANLDWSTASSETTWQGVTNAINATNLTGDTTPATNSVYAATN